MNRTTLAVALLMVLGIEAEAQTTTIYWKKDFITDTSGAVIATATPQPIDTTAPSPAPTLTYSTSGGAVTLSWTTSSDSGSGLVGYRVYRGVLPIASTGTAVNCDNNTHVCFTDNTASGNADSYMVVAVDAAGNSTPSNTATLGQVPATPTNISVSVVSSTELSVSWTDASTDESTFRVESKVAGGTYSLLATINGVSGSGSTVTYPNTGLTPSMTYYYRVLAHNGAGDSSYTSEVNATTSAGATAPAAPSSLSGQALSAYKIEIYWQDNSSDETNFYIERKVAGGSYTQVGTQDPNIPFYTDGPPDHTALTPSTTYYYRVRAHNSGGNSSYSNEISVATLSGPTPNPPGNFTATLQSGGSIVLTWDKSVENGTNEPKPTYYALYRRMAGYTDYVNWVDVPGSTAATFTYTDTSLGTGEAGSYYVRAVFYDVGGYHFSARSRVDVLARLSFDDDPVTTSTTVQARHITQLRTAIEAVRAAAGYTSTSWTDSTLAAGTQIKAVHIAELRSNLNQALATLLVTLPSYTDPGSLVGVAVKKAHIEEVRNAVK